jgi:hypothetical protein
MATGEATNTTTVVISPVDSTSSRTEPANDEVNQTRKPSDVALKQQRMKSWQPLLSPRWVIAAYFLIAVIFIPVGECCVQLPT